MATSARAQTPTTQDAAYSRIARHGDSMQGPLELWQDPVDPLEAATKQYVDTQTSSAGIPDAPQDGYVYGRLNGQWVRVTALAGGTMTGPLILSEDPT